jgi:hypothetical protein
MAGQYRAVARMAVERTDDWKREESAPVHQDHMYTA